MKPLWRITLFSHLEACRGEEPPQRLQIRKSGALLAYLAYHSERGHLRETLAELLWPDGDMEAQRGNLRSALHELRKRLDSPSASLNPSVILSEGECLRLNPGLATTDVAEYNRALAHAEQAQNETEQRARLEHAVALYGGALLPGIGEEWARDAREALAETQRGALARLTTLHENAGDIGKAIACARQAIRLDRTDEAAHCRLMRLYVADEQNAAALAQYERLKYALKRDLQMAPSPEAEGWARQARARRQAAPISLLSAALGNTPPTAAGNLSNAASPPARAGGRKRAPKSSLASPVPFLLRAPGLPAPPTPFFGREHEIKQCHVLLTRPGTRLVTLAGPGGMGKTRLGIEAARAAQDAFEGRVFWADLTTLQSTDSISEAIAETLLLSRQPNTPALQQLAEQAGRARLLLVLDNFEHLVTTQAAAVGEILRRMPGLTLLVTSRERLQVQGEQICEVQPLPLPEQTREITEEKGQERKRSVEEGQQAQDSPRILPADLLDSPAVQLFVERARQHRADFTLNPGNAPHVAALCARLEGIPLALELAAAWIGALEPSEILERLEQRFALLVSPYRDAPARHASLHAMIASSYAALTDAQKRVFARLSVFRDGWTVEAAQAVCEEAGFRIQASEEDKAGSGTAQSSLSSVDETIFPDDLEVLHVLRELVNKSLIQARDTSGGMRYGMLETLREFGQERLDRLAPGEWEKTGNAHAAYYLQVAESANPHLRGAEQVAWLNRLEADHDNLRAALHWLRDTRQAQESWRMAGALTRFWQMRGHAAEGREHFARVLALEGDLSRARVVALRCAGLLASEQDDAETAQPLLEQSLALARQLQDTSGIAWALYSLAHNRPPAEAMQAREQLEEGLRLFDSIGERRGVGASLHKIGTKLLEQGLYPQAGAYFERSAALFAQIGDRHNQALSLLNIGTIYVHLEDNAGAKTRFKASLAAFEAVGNEWLANVVWLSIAIMLYQAGEYKAAERSLRSVLAAHRRHGARLHEAMTLCHLGILNWLQKDYRAAREYSAASLDRLPPLRQSLHHALTLLAFALPAADAGQWERAACLSGAALSLMGHNEALLTPFMRRHCSKLRAQAQEALGEARFVECLSQGRALTWEQAAQYALQEP